MTTSALPFLAQPHDSLRLGLPSLKEDVAPKHPVEVIQIQGKHQAESAKLQMMRDLYGAAAPARLSIETQILQRYQRLPGSGCPSSLLGLESMTGALDDFCFESYLGLPEACTDMPPDMHSQMAHKLKLGMPSQTQSFF
ncbi:proteasome maturation factor UMP1 [Haematococcus lacustris]|uniref:Proteasome maturation protein n=1 Tax=Haematococcus lacustris TaxID=44745 RepID=A0A6A0AIH5_HAELA|nr:hypothetical protein QJQ45_029341 [Haematococcus lacustris]GFH32335.1 predicted protein [Haematococcus lacustris]